MRFAQALGAAALASLASLATASSPILAQYWPAYNSEQQSVSQIPWTYSSKNGIAYYFVTITTKDGFEVPADQPKTDINKFVSAAKANGVRPVFSVGGWDGSIHFSDLVKTASKQATFAKQIKSFMDKYGFVGVDLDWEYPNGVGIGCNAVSGDDSAHLLAFLKVLRSQIGSSKLITAAVSTDGFLGANGKALSDFKPYGQYLDYINLMTDTHSGSWSSTTGPDSPLRKCSSDSSVQTAIKLWTSRGFPASKILLGVPAYAISFTTKSSSLSTTKINNKWSSKAYQPWTGVVPMGAPGDSNAPTTDVCGTKTAAYSGQWQFKDLVANGLVSSDGMHGKNGYKRYFDQCSQAPFLFNPSKKHYISYEDSRSVAVKTAYAKQQGLGGVFVFDSAGFTNEVYSSLRSSLYSRKSRRHELPALHA
ncbi:hypothetical protein JCM10020v2_002382 [Rhodotorula toruloides]